MTICVFDDNYIPFFLFLSLFLLLFSLACFLFYRGREEKKIECVELFYWCTQRVGRPVCCNQQTNIIIWRACILYMERKRERNLTSSIFFSSLFKLLYVFVSVTARQHSNLSEMMTILNNI